MRQEKLDIDSLVSENDRLKRIVAANAFVKEDQKRKSIETSEKDVNDLRLKLIDSQREL
jgi:hypothetical protein